MAVNEYHIILASQSPRRKMLLQGLGIDFEVRPSSADETYPAGLSHDKVAEYIAMQKALLRPKLPTIRQSRRLWQGKRIKNHCLCETPC